MQAFGQHLEESGHTLDFTLRNRETGKVFVAEMKCELEFKNYRYLRLIGAWHHRGAAVQKFLRLAKDPGVFEMRVGAGRNLWISVERTKMGLLKLPTFRGSLKKFRLKDEIIRLNHEGLFFLCNRKKPGVVFFLGGTGSGLG